VAKSVGTAKKRPGFGKIGNFFREVGLELKKVHWPTRKQLLIYTAVVLVSVAIMAAIIGVIDLVLFSGMEFVLGR